MKSPLLLAETFRHYLALDGSSPHYRPIQNISYFFDYLVWNADPFGFHLSNVLWHRLAVGFSSTFSCCAFVAPFRSVFG